MDELETLVKALETLKRNYERRLDQLDNQSYTLRELAHYLSENGVSVSRFTRRTQETLVAVALNGDY